MLMERYKSWIRKIGEKEVEKLGDFLHQVNEDFGDHKEMVNEQLFGSKLLQGKSEKDILDIMAIAIGAAAAREAFNSHAIKDVVLTKGMSAGPDTIALSAADAIALPKFYDTLLATNLKLLSDQGLTTIKFKALDHNSTLYQMAKSSYLYFSAPLVEKELKSL